MAGATQGLLCVPVTQSKKNVGRRRCSCTPIPASVGLHGLWLPTKTSPNFSPCAGSVLREEETWLLAKPRRRGLPTESHSVRRKACLIFVAAELSGVHI
jgi:hypothetical protein